MTNQYTNMYQVFNDVSLYMAIRLNQPLALDMFPVIIQNRFTWFVQNWNNLLITFTNIAAGDQTLQSSLDDFNNIIALYQTSGYITPIVGERLVNFSPFFQSITLDQLGLNASETQVVNLEIKRVTDFLVADFRSMQTYLRSQLALSSALNGGYDPDGHKLAGYPSPAQGGTPTFASYDQINRIFNFIKYIKSIIFELKQNELRPPDLLSLAKQNINVDNSGVTIDSSYLSSVSVPFEMSLENMARKYLNNVNKWYELVTVNNLQAPYVDEVGTKYYLSVPGSPSSLTILPDRTIDILLGQKIKIGSASVVEETRIILKKTENNDGSVTIILSGAHDIDKLTVKGRAYVRIFKPHTVNTGSYVLIPINIRSPIPNAPTPSREELKQLDKALLDFGVDIKVDEKTNEYLTDSYGNFVLCYGLDNVRQAVHQILQTALGELPRHPSYGVNVDIGSTWGGSVSEGMIYAETITSSILKDRRFNGATVQEIKANGTSLSVSLTVTIVGTDVLIPLAYVV